MSTNITQWRLDKAAARLLDGCPQWSPSSDWKCWVKPTPALPIDDFIMTLRQSNRPPRLRGREELFEGYGVLCPYYAARWAIAMAVDAATVAAQDDAAEMKKRWRQVEQAAKRAAPHIASLAQLLTTRPPVTRLPLTEPREFEQFYQIIVALHHSEGLAHIATHASQARKIFLNNQGNVWRLVFAANLGLTWRLLTGNNPTLSDPFIGFIAAAFESLTDNPSSISWEWSIRRALEMGIDWQRYEHRKGKSQTRKGKFQNWKEILQIRKIKSRMFDEP